MNSGNVWPGQLAVYWDKSYCPSPHSQIPNILNKLGIKVYNVLGKVGQIYGVSRQLKPQRRQIDVSQVKT